VELAAAAACAAAAVALACVPADSAPLAVVAAVAVAPPALLGAVALRARRWWAAAGGSLIAAANVVFYGLWVAAGAPTESWVFHTGYVLGYSALVGSAALLGRGGRRGTVLDATIVVSGPALVVLSTLARPLLVQQLSLHSATSLLYLCFDLALLLLVVRACLAGTTRRLPASALLVAALLLLGGNLAFLLIMVWLPPSLVPWLAVPFALAYSLMAVAVTVMPPAGRRTGAPGETGAADPGGPDWRTAHREPAGGSRSMLVLLPTAACLPAAALVVQGVTGGVPDWQVLGAGAVLTAVLSTVRLHSALRVAADQSLRLERLAHRDELTDLPNRRRCTTAARALLASGTSPVALALLDLDRFKTVNDTLGHDAGDALLRAAAAEWRRVLPPTAGLYRWGGEEFVVLLADDDAERALDLLEDVRRSVPAPHTVSAGLVRHRPGEDLRALVTRADGLLYAAKAAGRDRVHHEGLRARGLHEHSPPVIVGFPSTAERGQAGAPPSGTLSSTS
jgi:diguanylate cyclase (GGDEF)-like protein